MPASLVVVAAPQLIGDRVIETPDDLAELPWLLEIGANESSDWLRRRSASRTRAGGVTQVPGNLMLDGVRNGQGVAFTVLEWVRQDIADGRLVELSRDREDGGYYIVTRPGIQRHAAKTFVKWLRRQAPRDGSTPSR